MENKTKNKQKITPNLWFDNQAEEAANYYTTILKDSKILKVSHYTAAGQETHGQPEGQVMTAEFEIAGQKFTALNGGPIFKFNPSISFFVNCGEEEINELWNKLSDGGSVLMPLQKYSFSELYGWTQDKYGLSWQVMLTTGNKIKQKISPSLMFVGDLAGHAEDAMLFYASVFNNAKIGNIYRYEKGEEPDQEGTIKYADFILEDQKFQAMDSNLTHFFKFNEAVSFIINCDGQEEVDYYWNKLSADPAAEQCGWLKDKYGVSWQIVPGILTEMISDTDARKAGRVMNAMLKMKKINIQLLKQAYEENS